MKMSMIVTGMTALALVILCGGVVLVPPTAEAASEITGLTVSPSPATRGSLVTIAVTGRGDPCPSIDLDFGDGMRHETLSGPFPRPTTHIYTSAGTVTLRARGVKGCTGDVTKTLTVSATSPGSMEPSRPPILPPPAALPPVQPPKPQIEIETQPRLAPLPVIEEFMTDLTGCDLPDPNRLFLAFRASHEVVQVHINALTRDGRERLVFEEALPLASQNSPWVSIERHRIRDPGANAETTTYVLVVRGASGQQVSMRRNVVYLKGPVSLDASQPAGPGSWDLVPITPTSPPYEYSVAISGANFEGIAVNVRYPTESGLSRSLNPRSSEVRVRGDRVWFTSPVRLNEHGDATIVLTAYGRLPRCPGQQVEQTVILPKAREGLFPNLPR